MLYRRPLHEVAAWPAGEVRLLDGYLAKQPPLEQRIEYHLARLLAMFHNRYRDPTSPGKDATDFLQWADPWPVIDDEPEQEGRYSAADLTVLKALMV